MENLTGKLTFRVESVDQLPQVAQALRTFCSDRRVVTFTGEMGAGKTTFIRRFCEWLGVEENVSSPTFSLVNEYRGVDHARVFHFDLYRLKSPAEALEIGVEEYFHSGDWCLVEWPEKAIYLIPEHRVDVRILVDRSDRILEFSYG